MGVSEKYQNKYRTQSIRLQHWDYGWNGAYFVTICTHNRDSFFGQIQEGIMKLSEIGQLANRYWQEIPDRFPFIILDAFVVMPNHVHGIIIINKSNNRRIAINRDSTVTKSKSGGITGNKNPMLHDNLSRIIRWYKGRITFESRKIHTSFAWQSRFYDHIIRDDESFQSIATYIRDNPTNWQKDEMFDKK